MTSLHRQIGWAARDPIVRLAAVLAVLVYLPYLLPVFSREGLAAYAYSYRDLPLVALLVGVHLHRARGASGADRRFFGLLATAFAGWLTVHLVDLLTGGSFRSSLQATFVEDLLWVAAYLLLALAVQLRGEGRLAASNESARRALEAAGTVIFAFGLLVYFVVLPSSLNPEEYGTFAPSLLLYAGLDLYLVVRFARAALLDREGRQPALGWLAAAAVVWFLTDAFDALGYLGVAPSFDFGSRLEWIYLPGLVLAIVAGRAHRVGEAEERREDPATIQGHSVFAGTVVLPLLLVALHFGLYGVGALDDVTRPAREVVLLVMVVALAGIGLVSQRLLERENERLSAERSAALERLQEGRRLEALGRLTAGVAHDFNNLLTVMMGSAQVVERELAATRPGLAEDLREITAAGERGATVVRQLLAYARQQRLLPRPTRLSSLVRSRLPALQESLPDGVALAVEGDEVTPPALVDASAVEEMLVHLVRNAAEAMPGGGEIVIRTRVRELDEKAAVGAGVPIAGTYLSLAVADEGAGMDAATAQRAFEPFFTTKAPERGSGLGLAMVHGIVAQHGGAVSIDSQPGRGTTVVVLLPASDAEPGEEPVAAPEPERGAETVLVVEDQEAVRRTATRVLEHAGYRVVGARNGREGLEVFRRHRGSIGLIVSDVVMPEMTGPELHAAVWAESKVPFLFMSGFAPEQMAGGHALPKGVPFIHKPWRVLDFLARIREMLDEGVADSDLAAS